MDEDWDSYETGPFCPHYDHPDDCEEKCACGHPCRVHKDGIGRGCDELDCPCMKFEEPV